MKYVWDLLAVPAYIALGTYVFWLLAIVYFSAVAKWDQLKWQLKALLLPLGIVFYLFDIAFNFTLGSLIFWQLPSFQAPTLSLRMRDINAAAASSGETWRSATAGWICKNMLDIFQQGHC